MNNIIVIKKEYVFCPRDHKEIEMDDCMKCILNMRKTRIGFTTFVQCDYKGESK
jgi:hypothetical protein